MIDWGIPDWRDDSAYLVTCDWEENRWRWEFLRRRDDYRVSFETALQGQEQPLASAEDVLELEPWLIGDGMRAWPFMHPDAKKYGLLEFFDPVVSDWMTIGPEWNSGLVFGGFDGSELVVGESGAYQDVEAPYMSAYTFDLRRALGPQLDEVAELLKGDQFYYFAYGAGAPQDVSIEEAESLARTSIPRTKHHREKWLTYLRVLDAKAEGATLAQIADLLPESMSLRDQQAAHNVVKQARELQFRF